MDLADRMAFATLIIVALYACVAVAFFAVKAIVRAFGKQRFDSFFGKAGEPVAAWLRNLVLAYPALVLYAFAVNTYLGFVVLFPFLLLLVYPELGMAQWGRGEDISLPERVVLTHPWKKIGDYYQTRVEIDGERWTAKIVDDGVEPPPLGDTCRVVGREGLALNLAPADADPNE